MKKIQDQSAWALVNLTWNDHIQTGEKQRKETANVQRSLSSVPLGILILFLFFL